MLLYISTILHLKVHGIRIHRYSDRDSLSSGISKKDCSKIRCGNDTESWEVDPQNDHEDQGWWWHLALKTVHTKKVCFEKKWCFCITGSGLFQLIYTYMWNTWQQHYSESILFFDSEFSLSACRFFLYVCSCSTTYYHFKRSLSTYFIRKDSILKIFLKN